MVIFITFFTFFMLHSDLALAWGPITHLEYSHHALAHLSLIAPSVARLLKKYSDHFLYGSIAADITLGKNVRGYMYNCHNWRVAFDIYKKGAKQQTQKAFMLGYLSHLAADTVAHNFYVPFKLIRSWNHRLLNHAVWEMRFDLSCSKKYWDLLGTLSGSDFKNSDKLLENHIKRSIFSFKTNKKIFNSLVLVQRAKNYEKMVHKLVNPKKWDLPQNHITTYKKLAKDAVIDFLKNLEKSYVLNADPTGKLKFLYARDVIRGLRGAKKLKVLTNKKEQQLLTDVKQSLKTGIYNSVALPEVSNYLPLS